MSEEQIECLNVIINVANYLLFRADFPCDFNYDVELVSEMYREYIDEYNLVDDCSRFKAAFKRAYYCIAQVNDESMRNMISSRCQRDCANIERLIEDITAKGWILNAKDRNAIRLLCRFWQRVNEIEGGE